MRSIAPFLRYTPPPGSVSYTVMVHNRCGVQVFYPAGVGRGSPKEVALWPQEASLPSVKKIPAQGGNSQ